MSLEPSEVHELYQRAQRLRDFTDPVETQTERLHEAVEIFTKLIELKAENLRLYTERALCYQKLKEYESARRDYREGIRRHPDHARLHTLYSQMLYEIGEYQEALVELDKALRLELVTDHMYDYRAKINTKLGNHEQAAEDQKRYDDYQAAEQAKWDDPNHYYHYK